jgi:hypothetical protein
MYDENVEVPVYKTYVALLHEGCDAMAITARSAVD